MRGSPVLRTLIVAAVLLLAGLGLARLTGREKPRPAQAPPQASTTIAAKTASFELILSAQAAGISLDAGGKLITAADTATPLSGLLEIPGEHPVISLRIRWADNSPGHRFAKLRLDIAGKETLEHVFSAPGDIDDIWEP